MSTGNCTLPSELFGLPPVSPDAEQKGLPLIVDAVSLVTNPPPKPPELIQGVLHQGSKMMIGGGSKSFKTWLLIDLALSVATGTHWIGYGTSKTRVLYANFELPEAFMAERLQSIESARGIEPESGCLEIWNLRGYAASISDLRERIIDSVKDGGYGLVVLDPVYKLLGDVDENSNTHVTRLLNEIEQISVQTEAAVVFGHHFSKGGQAGKASIDRVSGAGAWARDPDSILTLTEHESESCFVAEFTLRNHAPRPAFVLRHEFPLMKPDESLDPAKLKRAGRKKTYSASQLAGLIPESGITHKELRKAAMDKEHGPGMSSGTFNNLLREAEKDELLKKDDDGKYHSLLPYCGWES